MLCAGVTASAAANFGVKELDTPLQPSDFFTGLDEPTDEEQEPDPQQMIALLTGFAASCNRAAGMTQ